MSEISSITTFTPDTIIDSDVHNTDHSAFRSAINDNHNRITTLESGTTTLSGIYTFDNALIASTIPTLSSHLTNKSYVDDNFLSQSLLGSKGDLFGTDGTDISTISVGSNGQVLTADSTATNGLSWSSLSFTDNLWSNLSGNIADIPASAVNGAMYFAEDVGTDGTPYWYNGTSWNAISTTFTGTLAVNQGGTGATTASNARTNLGAVAKAGDTLTGFLSLHADPTNAMHAATKQYVDGVASGLELKESCVAASTGNLTLSGEQTIDGVAVVTGNRVLVKNQTTASENGIYVVDSGAWSRSADLNTTGEAVVGVYTFITGGTTQQNTGWVIITAPATLGTNDLGWTQYSGSTSYNEGSGIDISGSSIAVDESELDLSLFTQGLLSEDRGGTGIDTSGSTGIPKITAGTWTVNANTDDLSEGSANLYFTNERVDDRVAALLQPSASNGITWSYNDGSNTLTPVLADNVTNQKVKIANNGTDIGTRRRINFIPGTNVTFTISDNSVSDRVDITFNNTNGTAPAGSLMPYAGTSAPSGWLFCYGQAVSRTTYSNLFSALGTTFGTGDGSTTFNLPDLRGRTVIGKDNMGGSAANRVTSASTDGTNSTTLGGVGGSETHTLTEAQMPQHSHRVYYRNEGAAGGSRNELVGSGSADDDTATSNAGSSQAHNNCQPWISLNYIIKT